MSETKPPALPLDVIVEARTTEAMRERQTNPDTVPSAQEAEMAQEAARLAREKEDEDAVNDFNRILLQGDEEE